MTENKIPVFLPAIYNYVPLKAGIDMLKAYKFVYNIN